MSDIKRWETVEFEINPYVGAGRILLGMTQIEVQDTLGTLPKRKFRKFKDDDFDTDACEWCFVGCGARISFMITMFQMKVRNEELFWNTQLICSNGSITNRKLSY